MNREDIIAIAREIADQCVRKHSQATWTHDYAMSRIMWLIGAERNKVAQWMIRRSYATGHGDSVEDLLKELEWQVAEAEREACAKIAETAEPYQSADLIRKRGQA